MVIITSYMPEPVYKSMRGYLTPKLESDYISGISHESRLHSPRYKIIEIKTILIIYLSFIILYMLILMVTSQPILISLLNLV